MILAEKFQEFEDSFLPLQRMMEKRQLTDLDKDNLIPLLKTAVLHGWDALRSYTEQREPVLATSPYSLHQTVERENFPLKENIDLDLQLDNRSFDEMEWEIREIIYPAFRDLYLFLKNIPQPRYHGW